MVQTQRGTVRQVVKYRRGAFKKKRQIIFYARRGHALTDIFIYIRFGWVTLEAFAKSLTEASLAIFIQGKFTRRQQPNFRHGIKCALRIHIK